MSLVESVLDGKLGNVVLVVDNFLSEAGWVIIAIIFFAAFSHPSDAARVTINTYGEKWIEAILIPIVVCITFLGSYIRWHRGEVNGA